jgi:hypothetical protein
MPQLNSQAQSILDQGHEVGALARKLFPDGVEVEVDDLDAAVRMTQEATKKRRPMFEAPYNHEGGYARTDILVPVGSDAWDLVEVKSSTEVTKLNVFDLAFQTFVCAGAGLKIRRCLLFLIDSGYVRHGDVDPTKLFMHHDVTHHVLEAVKHIKPRLAHYQTGTIAPASSRGAPNLEIICMP